jgi:hypothetical protein
VSDTLIVKDFVTFLFWCDTTEMIQIRIALFDLMVEVSSDASYPDAVSDLANRASSTFITALTTAKMQGIDLITYLDDDEEEIDD